MGAPAIQGGGFNAAQMMSVGASASASITNGVPQTATSTTVNGQTQNTVNGQSQNPALQAANGQSGFDGKTTATGGAGGGAGILPGGEPQAQGAKPA